MQMCEDSGSDISGTERLLLIGKHSSSEGAQQRGGGFLGRVAGAAAGPQRPLGAGAGTAPARKEVAGLGAPGPAVGPGDDLLFGGDHRKGSHATSTPSGSGQISSSLCCPASPPVKLGGSLGAPQGPFESAV